MHLRISEINNEQTFISHRPLSLPGTHHALLSEVHLLNVQ